MKLYYSKGACSLAVRIILNEIGISVEFEAVDLKTKKTEKNTDFLTINPKGSVPVIVTNDGKVLTENGVIQQYLADSTNSTELLPPVNDFKRYRVLEWLNFISSDLHKGFSPLFNPKVSKEEQQNVFIPILKKHLNFVEVNLGEQSYLLGDTFTLPDSYLFVILSWLDHVGIQLADWKHLSRYFNELKNRPSIAKALAEDAAG